MRTGTERRRKCNKKIGMKRGRSVSLFGGGIHRSPRFAKKIPIQQHRGRTRAAGQRRGARPGAPLHTCGHQRPWRCPCPPQSSLRSLEDLGGDKIRVGFFLEPKEGDLGLWRQKKSWLGEPKPPWNVDSMKCRLSWGLMEGGILAFTKRLGMILS